MTNATGFNILNMSGGFVAVILYMAVCGSFRRQVNCGGVTLILGVAEPLYMSFY